MQASQSSNIYFQKEIGTHSNVESLSPKYDESWSKWLIKRRNEMSDVMVVVADSYELSEAQVETLPRNIDFVVLTRAAGPGYDEAMMRYLWEREIGVGKLHEFKAALNRPVVWDYYSTRR